MHHDPELKLPSASMVARRSLLLAGPAAFLLTSCARAAAAREVTVYKTTTCGCCKAWVTHLSRAGFAPKVIDQDDLQPIKTQLRVPPDLVSCHTGVVGGYVLEGHVPPDNVVRLLREKPTGVLGLAVAGMPRGSPGMEMPDGAADPYEVIAFGSNGKRSVFARHG